VESFNGKLRDELLDRELFYTLQEAKILIGQWWKHYNRIRPHSPALAVDPHQRTRSAKDHQADAAGPPGHPVVWDGLDK
jgi:transposase InsO family protein